MVTSAVVDYTGQQANLGLMKFKISLFWMTETKTWHAVVIMGDMVVAVGALAKATGVVVRLNALLSRETSAGSHST
jgi:hypothetical protein